MALIKSKQIKELLAGKIVQTPEMQFVSATEKSVYEDKYTVAEMDAKVVEIGDNIEEAKTELNDTIVAKETSLKGEIADAKVELEGVIGDAKSELEGAIDDTKSELEGAIGTAKSELEVEIGSTKTELSAALDSAKNQIASDIVDAKAEVTSDLEGKIAAAIGSQYSNEQIDAKLEAIKVNIKYKGKAPSKDDLDANFPNAKDGWLVAVEKEQTFFVYDEATAEWIEFPISTQLDGYAKTIVLAIAQDGQAEIQTGIRMDGVGVNTTDSQSVQLHVNGFLQTPAVDYVVKVVGSELVIEWKGAFELEMSDAVAVTFNQVA